MHLDSSVHHTHGPGLNCAACEELRRAVVQALTPSLTFEVAAKAFIEMRSMAPLAVGTTARYVRANTKAAWQRHTISLALFFGGMPLGEIHWYNMRAYQQVRVAGDPPFVRKRRPHEQPSRCPVLPQQVNQELGFLKRLKKMALCWTPEDALYFKELQEEEREVQRALSPDEQAHWLDTARSKDRWDIVFWYSLVAFDTLASTNELRSLRLADVNLQGRMMSIPWPGSKNKFRHRKIALENADSLWALDRLLHRAGEMGSVDPQHYLFPFHITRSKRCVPDRPMTDSGLKKRWEEVRLASDLLWFRPYDTRHTGATRYAENGTPVDIIVARMGHANAEMRQIYTHISEAAARKWAKGAPQGGYAPARGKILDDSRRWNR